MKKVCFKCKQELPIEKFHLDGGGKRRGTCGPCRNSHLKVYRGQVSTWGERAYKTRFRANSKGWDHDLTAEFLESLWNAQQGKCFYTGGTMTDRLGGEGRSPYSVSIDRVDSNRGYTQDNVVLCTTQSNTMKSNLTLEELKLWFPKWHRKIVKFQKRTINGHNGVLASQRSLHGRIRAFGLGLRKGT